MDATEITKAEKTTLHARPVFIQGIMQKTLRKLTQECDVKINGLTLRLPPDAIICVLGGGVTGTVGKLMTDVDFHGRDGQTYRATQGMDLFIPSA